MFLSVGEIEQYWTLKADVVPGCKETEFLELDKRLASECQVFSTEHRSPRCREDTNCRPSFDTSLKIFSTAVSLCCSEENLNVIFEKQESGLYHVGKKATRTFQHCDSLFPSVCHSRHIFYLLPPLSVAPVCSYRINSTTRCKPLLVLARHGSARCLPQWLSPIEMVVINSAADILKNQLKKQNSWGEKIYARI